MDTALHNCPFLLWISFPLLGTLDPKSPSLTPSPKSSYPPFYSESMNLILLLHIQVVQCNICLTVSGLFTSYNVRSVYSSCHKWQDFCLLGFLIIFHHLYSLLCPNLFVTLGYWDWFHTLANVNYIVTNIWVYMFLQGTYLISAEYILSSEICWIIWKLYFKFFGKISHFSTQYYSSFQSDQQGLRVHLLHILWQHLPFL